MKLNQLMALIALAAGGMILYGSQSSWAEIISVFGSVSVDAGGEGKAEQFVVFGIVVIVAALASFVPDMIAQLAAGVVMTALGIVSWLEITEIRDDLNNAISSGQFAEQASGLIVQPGQGLNLIIIGSIISAIMGVALAIYGIAMQQSIDIEKAPVEAAPEVVK